MNKIVTEKNNNYDIKIRRFLESIEMWDVDPELTKLALTHRSYSVEKGIKEDNERLEFLGDSLLGFLVSHYLYEKYHDADEGILSKKKARIVSRSMLGRKARRLGLGDLLRLGKGEELSGGRNRTTLLGCALEALIGAFYLSTSMDNISNFVHTYIFKPADKLLKEDAFADYKSRLQEFVQKKYQIVPEYNVLSESGPDHNKIFNVVVIVNGAEWGRGTGSRKKEAENMAAKEAMMNIEKNGNGADPH